MGAVENLISVIRHFPPMSLLYVGYLDTVQRYWLRSYDILASFPSNGSFAFAHTSIKQRENVLCTKLILGFTIMKLSFFFPDLFRTVPIMLAACIENRHVAERRPT
jgi:hypothetical protein